VRISRRHLNPRRRRRYHQLHDHHSALAGAVCLSALRRSLCTVKHTTAPPGPGARRMFFMCVWLLMIFAGMVHGGVGIAPIG
jgi:hypothetical protein